MKTIAQILNEKGKKVWHISPDTTVFNALKEMAAKDVGALLVLQGEKIVGVFSERDYARKVILKGKSSKKLNVSEIMSTQVVSISPDQNIDQGLSLMTDTHVRHLPVVENDKVLGVVSIGDLVKAIIAEQRQVIDKLEKYILENMSIT